VYTYDSLNRLAQANTVNTTSANCWGETYSVDNWGNLTNRAAPSGMSGSCLTEGLSATATNLNQLGGVGLLYDAAGNVTTDNLGNTYTYDAENRISAVEGYTYYYDADGTRMEKTTGSSGTTYWQGPSGTLTETDITGTINEEYIFFNGQRIARVDRPTGTVNYYFSDKLGSASVITGASGTVQAEYFYYPYGGLFSSSGSDPNHYKFTGKERDSETNLDQFGARYYTSSIGRFMTPDWAARPTSVPYAVFGDPQSLNLYTYVRNDPVSRADADGHVSLEAIDPTCSDPHGCGDALSRAWQETQNKDQSTQTTAAQNKPLTPAQIKKAFYKQHGKDMNAAVKKVFGKDASKVSAQTLANSPKLDTSKSRADLSQMKGMKEPVEGFNHPDMSQYPAGPIAAQNGTIYISSDLVKSGDMPEIFGTYAHELGNLLDMQVNARETTYGDRNDKWDNDTGWQVEKTMFPQ
jgi:RHS repeat-associated protein